MKTIGAALERCRVGRSRQAGSLTMIPLLRPQDGEPHYLTLDEALDRGTVVVTEVSERGSVPELLLKNDGDRPVLIVDGEELVGAKQNRVVNLSILVPAATQLNVPVSCVEEGRWQHRTRSFRTSSRAHYARGRALKMRSVSASLAGSGARLSDQHAIWGDIEEKASRFRVSSPTRAASDIFESADLDLQRLQASLEAETDQVGAVFLVDGVPAGVDLFDSPSTWKKLMPKLVQSYGLDALDQAPRGRRKRWTDEDVAGWLSRVAHADAQEYPAVGMGQDVRLGDGRLTGGALVVDGAVLHLAAFEENAA